MAKVRNKSGRTVTVLRWKILPDGRVISPMGVIVSDLPDDVVYSSQARHFANQGIIAIDGHSLAADKVAARPAVPDLPEVDDLTELANIGASRVKKLRGMGVHTFQDLIDFGAEAMSDLLQIEAAVAESIVEEAVSKFGVVG